MQAKIDITLGKATNYQEKYDALKALLDETHQSIDANYTRSVKTRLINTLKYDDALVKKEINYKQAYFELLNTCYAKAKGNKLCIFFISKPEKFARLDAGNVASDIVLRKELPQAQEITQDVKNVSILTSTGLYQYALVYTYSGYSGKFLQILTKEELDAIGFQSYLTKAETVDNVVGDSIKAELIENQLIYTLDMEIKKKSDLSSKATVYSQVERIHQHCKYHTVSLAIVSNNAGKKLKEAKSPKTNISSGGAGELFEQLFDLRRKVALGYLTDEENHYSQPITPAAQGAHGSIQYLCSFDQDIYQQLDAQDRMLIELFNSIEFLGKDKVASYKAKIKNETSFENDVKDLIQEIVQDIYEHAKTMLADKAQCYALVNKYLVANGYDHFERHQRNFHVLGLALTKEKYIEYTMEQWKDNKQHKTPNKPSFYDNMNSLLEEKTDELSDFKYDVKQNNADSQYHNFDSREGEQVYKLRHCSTEYKNLLLEQNPIIVKALYDKYRDVNTSPDMKDKVKQFISELDQFEAQVNKLRLQAKLFEDNHIADSTKAAYCNELKSNIEETKQALLGQETRLKGLVDCIFAGEAENEETAKAVSAILIILGATTIMIGAAVAFIALSPFFGTSAMVAGVMTLAAAGFFGSKSISSKAQKITSDVYEQGEKAIVCIESQKQLMESRTTPESNDVPSFTF